MKIKILATSDMHGFVLPTNFTKRDMNLSFGVAKARSKIKELENQATGPVIKIENGDLLQGSPLAYYLEKESKKGVYPLTQAMNTFGYQAGVLGNHDFNYGLDYLNSYIDQLGYPIFVANVFDESGKPAFGERYQILEFEGVKIALLGFVTQYIPHWEKPSALKGLQFKSIVEVAGEILPRIREQADLVIVAYHGGFEKDLNTGEDTEALTGENEGYQLLKEYGELIDALVTGHQHRELAQKVFGIPIIQPGFRGAFVGEIELEVNENKKVINASAKLHSTGEMSPDEEVLQLTSESNQEVEDWLDKPIGKILGDMTISDAMKARYQEHPYIEFINRLQMKASGAKISGTALFSNEQPGFGKLVTNRDVLTNYIYSNTLAVLRVTGKELRQALERTAEHLEVINDKIVFSPRFTTPKPEYYNYDMYEGIDYRIELKNPIGNRITKLMFEGHDLSDDEIIEVAVNQYRAVGGGNYEMFSVDKIVREINVDMIELIIDYFKKNPVVEAKTNNNFEVLK